MNNTKKTPMKRAREEAGLTLEQVSAGTGIPFTTIHAFESGRAVGWSLERKKKIATFLKVPFFSLWPEEQKKLQNTQKIIGQTDEGRR